MCIKVENCPYTYSKVLDLDGDDSEDISKLVTSPGGIYSSQVSPIPLDDIESAQEAFTLIGEENKIEELKSDDILTKSEEPVYKPERRSSTSWKGFKKQLSRVDLKLKQTFSAPTERTGKRSSVFYSSSSGFVTPNEKESGENSEASNSSDSEDNSKIPVIKEPVKDSNDEFKEGGLHRPTDLQLFDGSGKPLRPPRGKEKKKMSLDHKGPPVTGTRADGRLLSVPNIKYHAQGMKDLRRKDNTKQAANNNQSFGNLMRKLNKLDSSFSRSRSSSMSSLENISSEAIQCLAFADSYTKKSEAATFPTLWVGTSLGSVLTVMISVPSPGESRLTQPVAVSPCGTIFRLKGCILSMSFLDCNGALIPYSFESWKDEGREKQKTPTRCSSSNSRMSPPLGSTGSEVTCDRQFVALISEKQARVVALPSQNCVYRQQLADPDFVVKAEIISLKDSVCLVCYISNGHVTAYSLPSLRPLIDVEFLPLADLSFQTRKQGIVDPMLSIWGQQMFVNEDTDQIARTFCFSNRGHGLYLSSPTEVQKFTVSADFCSSLAEMVGDLFLPHDMPEPPKESFFKGLFGGGARNLDREELFGESSGRASRSVAKHIPGPSAQIEALGQRASIAASEISRAHQLALERGEKLGQLEDRAEKMKNEAENFSMSAHSLMLKYKDKKWYQL
uniref:V-SNARE coiled-coil homology domain-containing protein n=1 Tax=Clastoptera arizonana TaxID=38151 RepID=A0A1B6CQ53_9HEMI